MEWRNGPFAEPETREKLCSNQAPWYDSKHRDRDQIRTKSLWLLQKLCGSPYHISALWQNLYPIEAPRNACQSIIFEAHLSHSRNLQSPIKRKMFLVAYFLFYPVPLIVQYFLLQLVTMKSIFLISCVYHYEPLINLSLSRREPLFHYE